MDETGWILALVLVLEFWLGRTPRTRAGSIIELAWLVLTRLVRRKVAIVDVKVKGAKELDDVLRLLVNIARSARAGKSAADIAKDEVPDLVAAVSGCEGIPEEWAADPSACLSTVGARIGELAAVLVLPKAQS